MYQVVVIDGCQFALQCGAPSIGWQWVEFPLLLSFALHVWVEPSLYAMFCRSSTQTSIDTTATTADNSHGFPPPKYREEVSEEADFLSICFQGVLPVLTTRDFSISL